MTASELLALLESLDIRVAVTDGGLRVSAAKGRLTDDLRAAIAAQKPELIELLAAEASESSPVPRVSRTGPLPVSLFQERLWVLNKFEPGNTAYNMVTAWPSTGPVDVERMCGAIRGIVGRHEMLRARFQNDTGTPSVVLMPVDAVSIEVRDIREQSQAEQEATVGAAMNDAAHAPFDLSTEVPVRFIVFRAPREFVATVMAAHHIVADAWSFGLIEREILAAYRDEPAPAQSPLEYVDFAAWERTMQDRRLAGPDLDWWKRKLAGIPPVSSLPADGPRSPASPGAFHPLVFGRELSAGIRSLVREEGATVYMALLSACAAVLHWYTSQEDLVVGSPMGVRERPEFESIVGPFVNVLALRLSVSGDPTFAELLSRARIAVLDAHEHRHISFERLVERLRPARSLDHTPVFQVAVVQHAAGSEGSRSFFSGGAVFDLTWFVRDVDGRLVGGLEYRSDVYSARTIASVAARLEAVLSAAVADRHRRLSELSLGTADEISRVLDEFNATHTAIDPAPFTEQFQRRAAASPDAVAVRFEEATLSYRELNERANQIARHLSSLGIASGATVGLCMRRSGDMLASLIGIQKTGAAYLPLDPDFPAERLSFMLADSDARTLITNGPTPAGFEQPPGMTVLDLAAHAVYIAAQSRRNLEGGPAPGGTAYLIYTSGSTGRPKAVQVSHGALSNLLQAMRHRPGLSPSDTLAAVTTLSFDISGLELYLPLLTGACVVLVSRDEATNGNALADRLARSGVSVMQGTPATWRMLIEVGWRPRTHFRAFCGGEALPRDLANALLERVDELWNLYGPTETTIWSTVERVEAGEGRVSIGRPIANTRVYIVDHAGNPRPVGVPGEIWIGGAGVAIGYHGRPDLTAERFVPDRFGGKPGERLYRTGDLGRWLDDGRLEHLGRLDHQVKIRGFRIEPGEIETVLASHPAIAQATVIAREKGTGDLRLVAYLKFQPGQDLTVSEVRKYLRRELPEYMIPSVVVALDSLPLSSSGKIDRNALPDPFRIAQRTSAEYVAPASGTEQVLAEIWREILMLDKISAEDNFFELGGHSLLSLRVAAAVEKRLGWRMDPRVLFFQSLRQVAAGAAAPGHDGGVGSTR